MRIVLLIIVMMAACMPQRHDTLRQENAELREEIAELKKQSQKRDKNSEDSDRSESDEDKDESEDMLPVGNLSVRSDTTYVRGERPVYECVVGSEPRQLPRGRLLKIVNDVCDARNGSGGCAGAQTGLSIQIDAKRVVILANRQRQALLGPGQTCYVDIDYQRTTLRFERYRRLFAGPRGQPNFVAEEKYHTTLCDFEDEWRRRYDVTESRFWASAK